MAGSKPPSRDCPTRKPKASLSNMIVFDRPIRWASCNPLPQFYRIGAIAQSQPFQAILARSSRPKVMQSCPARQTKMVQLFHPLLALIASATDSLLARYVLYLKAENRILRNRISGEIHTKPAERTQLLKYGKSLGKAINELITIVTPGTFHRWVREEKRGRKRDLKGRPPKSIVLRELVLRIAKETGFGYTRILGELRRLGIGRICRQTVKNIVKEEGIEPSPKRSTGTWDQFLRSHTETLWGCDFFTKRAVTPRGFVDIYVLVFMHLETREVLLSPSTQHPNSVWVTKQAEAFVNHVAGREQKPTYLIHDRDRKFSAEFREYLKENGIKPKRLPIRSPNLNARVERFVQTIKYECLHHFTLYELQRQRVLQSAVMWTDDTRVTVLGGKEGSFKGYFWTYIGDDGHPYSVYDFTTSHSRDGPASFLEGYSGYLHADAYTGYDAMFSGIGSSVLEVACWAHTRRRFFNAVGNAPRQAHQVAEWIRQLYKIEHRAHDVSVEARRELRAAEAVPVLDKIETYLDELAPRALPKSALAKAVTYARNQWTALRRYTEDGRLTIDNNISERTLRHQAIGRKNWLFLGSEAAGPRAAVLYTILAGAKRHRIEPWAYVRDILLRLHADDPVPGGSATGPLGRRTSRGDPQPPAGRITDQGDPHSRSPRASPQTKQVTRSSPKRAAVRGTDAILHHGYA